MRLLVYPHDLSIGGSQINAIDLAASAAEAGHDVIVYGIPGPLVDYIERKGLRFIPARPLRYRPAPSRIAQLMAIAAREKIDLIHCYEWPPCLDAYYGAGLVLGTPILCTVLSMQVTPYVPKSVPLIMGTAELGDTARMTHRADVWVLEPPIDTEADSPLVDGTSFRRSRGVGESEILVVSVSRLALDLKLDALVRAIDAVDLLASRYAVRLVLVGDGAARGALEARGEAVNKRHGRSVVQLAGSLLDPREAYAAADIVVGMGSSALRALSIGRPVVVQGERGFSDVFEPSTYDMFLRQGFYGLADDEPGAARLAAQVERLIVDPALRGQLGAFGREVATTRFGLRRAAEIQLGIYRELEGRSVERRLSEAMLSARLAIKQEIDNHKPRRKREGLQKQQRLLRAAQLGAWPPRP